MVERGLAESRSQAQSLIMAGRVYLDNCKLEKPGSQVGRDVVLEVRGKEFPWVSRGGLKLDHGLNHFRIDILGATCLDIGASTGGFTDVLLARGATSVYAVDVGHGQLDWKLRQDERVIVLERTNARYLTSDDIPTPVSFLCCDASFISLTVVLPNSMAMVSEGGYLVALIKPQFEVGKGQVGRGGVVREPGQHKFVCDRISNWVSNFSDWSVLEVIDSPLTGASGNKEFLIAACKTGRGKKVL